MSSVYATTRLTRYTARQPLYAAVCVAMALACVNCDSVKETYQDLKPLSMPPLNAAQSVTLTPLLTKSLGDDDAGDLVLQPSETANVYYASNSRGHVRAVTAAGVVKWAVALEELVSAGVVTNAQQLIVGTRQGNIIALDLKKGGLLWKQSIGASVLSPSLLASDLVISIANDNSVTALNAKTGKFVWSFDIPTSSAPTVHGAATPVLYDQDTVIVTSSTGRIYGLDLLTGTPKWDTRVALSTASSDVGRMLDIQGTPLLVGHTLFTVSYQGQLTATSLDQGRMLWQKNSSSLRTLAEALGNVYVADVAGNITAYDQTSGDVVWTQSQLAPRRLSNPVILGRYLIVGDQAGVLHIIEQIEGKIVGRVKTSGAINTLSVINDHLLVQTTSGHLSIWQAN